MSAPRYGRLLRSGPWTRSGAAVVLTVLASLAALACLFDAASVRAAHTLAGRMVSPVTVVVWGHGLESSDAAAARAGDIIAAIPGVTSARPLDPAPGDDMVARLAGATDASEPRLVAVDTQGGGGALAAEVAQALRGASLPARVLGSSLTGNRGGRIGMATVAVGVLVPLGAAALFALTCALAALREASRASGTLELMRMAGAGDGYVAGLIRGRVASLALVCALWGGVAAMLVAALTSRVSLAGVAEPLDRADLISPWPLVLLALWIIGAGAAWLAARARLAKVVP
jgi:cell division transport system permease protein